MAKDGDTDVRMEGKTDWAGWTMPNQYPSAFWGGGGGG